jgi:two-component system, NtrC family, sensor kinase
MKKNIFDKCRNLAGFIYADRCYQPNQLKTLVCITGALAIGIILARQYLHIRVSVLQNIQHDAYSEVEQHAKKIDSWLAVLKARVEMLASTDIAQSLDWQKVEPIFGVKLRRLDEFSVLAMTRSDGWRHATQGEPVSIRDRDFFQKAMAGKVNVSDPLISRASGVASISVAAPIWSNSKPNTSPIGSVHGSVGIERLQKIISQLRYGDGSYAFAINSAGRIIVHSDSDLTSTIENPTPSLINSEDKYIADIAKLMLQDKKGIKKIPVNGKLQYVAYAPLQETDWSLALVIPSNQVEIQVFALDTMALFIVFLTVSIIVIIWRTQSFQQNQLKKLNQQLESQVVIRTVDLQSTVSQLEAEISIRKTVEQELCESKERLNAVISSAPLIIWALNSDGIFTLFDGQGLEILGLKPSQIVGASVFEVYNYFPIIVESIEKALIGEEVNQINNIGNIFFDSRLVPNYNDAGEIVGITGIAVDVTSHKNIEKALLESEAKFRRLVEDVNDIIYSHTVDGLFTYLSPQFTKIFGYEVEEFIGKSFAPITHPEDVPSILSAQQEVIAGKKTQQEAEFRSKRKDGSWFWSTVNASPIKDLDGKVVGFQGVFRDISERKAVEELLRQNLEELKQTQAQLVQTEKMSSLGQLVAGVAHEINNPVSFIYGNLTHAREYVQDIFELINLYQQYYPLPDPAIQEKISDIEYDFLVNDLPKLFTSMHSGAQRIRDIVLSLRTFARLDEAELKRVDIHESLDSTLLILQHRLKVQPQYSEIHVVKNYHNLPLVECFAVQLNQVFLNILTNAIDAIDEYNANRSSKEIISSPGCITITTQTTETNKVTISIADNGIGIDEIALSKVFDPFYTTKDIGQGTGLGLSVSYKIITAQHRGAITCKSKLGQGSEFLIEIPINYF